MITFKYYDKIDAAAKADTVPFTPFNVNELGADGPLKRAMSRLLTWTLLVVFRVLRAVCPNPRIGRFVIVTREQDVREVLANHECFEVPFGREMRALTGGEDFALGLDPPAHSDQMIAIRKAVLKDDAGAIVEHVRHLATTLIDESGGRIDVMRDLTGRVLAEACSRYFGLDIEEPNGFLDRMMVVSALLFADPFGDPKTRRLALNGAARLHYLIDRAIKRARDKPRPNTVIDRLVEQQKTDPMLTNKKIRAIIIGLATGFVPTTALGAGKMLEELLRHREAWQDAIAHAKASEEARSRQEPQKAKAEAESLKKILLEAGRLNPALLGGQWRYARTDGVIAAGTSRQRKVPKGSVVLVATMSALRDRRKFETPGRFRTDRAAVPDLMFGDGTHKCLGMHLAQDMITEIFLVLLSRKNVAVSSRPVGWLTSLGPFPRRLDMVFGSAPTPATQTMVVIQAPVRSGVDAAQLAKDIGELRNPAGDDIRQALDQTRIVHFASMSVIDAGDDGKPSPCLLLELNVDGQRDEALGKLAEHSGKWLKPIFERVEDGDRMVLLDLLKRHALDLHRYPWGAIGLDFNGTPDCPVGDIARQKDLAVFTRDALADYLKDNIRLGSRPLAALQHVRSFILKDQRQGHLTDPDTPPERKQLAERGEGFENFLVRPSRRRLLISEWIERTDNEALNQFLKSPPVVYFVTLLAAISSVLATAIYCALDPFSDVARWILGATGASLLAILLVGVTRNSIDWLEVWLARVGRALPHLAVLFLCLVVLASGVGIYWVLDDLFIVLRLLLAAAGAIVATALLGVVLAGAMALMRRLASMPRWLGAVVALGVVVYGLIEHVSLVGWLLVAATGGVVATILILAIVAGTFLVTLRYHEMQEAPDDRNPPLDHVRTLLAKEDQPGYANNHITAVTPLKAGWFRKLTLAIALWGIGRLVAYWYRPGFVLSMGTIHYAKWFRLPRSEKLIFLANYDGSWESYLEDFIIKAHKGQTAAWGNGAGFPRSRFLILDGARDGDRFKRWVRRQQVVTQFWYSRFPGLTTDQIRNNAIIHDGLMRARTDTAARAWLDCLGTIPRPDNAIETEEVQSLVFGGLSALEHTACAIVQLPQDGGRRRRWLERLTEVPPGRRRDKKPPDEEPAGDVRPITFGDQPVSSGGETQKTATFVAFSAAGLAKLGVSAAEPSAAPPASDRKEPAELATFPGAFAVGMSNRHHVLGDVDDSNPLKWSWADAARPASEDRGPQPAADAIIFIYGTTARECEALLNAHKSALGVSSLLHVVNTEPAPRSNRKETYEHFGFRDGISQPVIRGTQRFARTANEVLPRDIVEPGEFIIGYRNNLGYFPPSPTVRGEADPGNWLPVEAPDFTTRFPRFRIPQTSDLRDFGRNGTFLAIRQLKQDVDEFRRFTEEQAGKFPKDLARVVGGPITAEWVAAKMMGRWRDGVSLIARPTETDASSKKAEPASPSSADTASAREKKNPEPDNDFNFGTEDPQGLQCPFGAHIRRANPRDSLQPGNPIQQQVTNRHRILRRGRSYGSDAEKGMLFVAICADVERQFEFMQQTWIGSPSFHGLNDEPDPIAATSGAPRVFTIPTPPGALVLKDMKNFVTVRGGGYFFLPSRSAMKFLSELAELKPPT